MRFLDASMSGDAKLLTLPGFWPGQNGFLIDSSDFKYDSAHRSTFSIVSINKIVEILIQEHFQFQWLIVYGQVAFGLNNCFISGRNETKLFSDMKIIACFETALILHFCW